MSLDTKAAGGSSDGLSDADRLPAGDSLPVPPNQEDHSGKNLRELLRRDRAVLRRIESIETDGGGLMILEWTIDQDPEVDDPTEELATEAVLGRGLRSDTTDDGRANLKLGHEALELSIESGAVTPDFTYTFLNVVTLTQDVTMNAPAVTEADTYILIIKQDGLGPWDITWDASYEWPGGTAPSPTGGKDVITLLVDDGGSVMGVQAGNFS